jgi:hypothetical protein
MLCLDAAFKAHLGLTISRRSRARDRCLKSGHPAIGPTEARAARDALHRSGPLRCGSKRLRRGLKTAGGTRLGLTRIPIDPSQASASATLIGRFNGRVIRNVSCTHRPRDIPPSRHYWTSCSACGRSAFY